MKKPANNSSKKTANTTGKNRHSKSTTKPVTIDLKAEAVSPKVESSDASTDKLVGNRSSVPKTKSSSSDKLDVDSQATSTDKPVFGRAEKSDNNGPDENSTKGSDKPDSKNADESDKKEKIETLKTASPISAKQPAPVQSSSGSSGRFVSAIAGGFVALGGAALLQYSGIIPSVGGNSASYVSQESLAGTQSALDAKIEQLQTRLDETSTALKSKAEATAVGEVDKRLTDTTTDLAKAITTAAQGDVDEIANQVNETTLRVQALQGKIEEATSQLGSLQALVTGKGADAASSPIVAQIEATTSQLKVLEEDITTLKAGAYDLSNKTAPAPSDTPETLAAIASLQTEVPALKDTITTLEESITKRVDTLDQKTAAIPAITEQVAGLKTAIDDVAARAAQGEATITALRQQSQKIVEDTQTVDKRAARAIAAASLKSQIDTGAPFTESLKTLQAVAPDNTELAKLETFSDKGIPNAASLNSQFQSVAEKITIAITPPPKDDLASRLLAGAKSFVKVEALTPESGDSPNAVVAQIRSAMAEGQLDQAASLWTKLPDEGKQVSGDWHKALEARITANNIVSQVVQSFLLTSTSN